MTILRKLIELNQRASKAFDQLLPAEFRVDGNTDFLRNFAPRHLGFDLTIVDVGSGKNPYLSVNQKAACRARIIGLDISAEELARAPEGVYDEIICADITEYVGDASADLAICQALLEHVANTETALQGISSALKPGGKLILFVPCRNAAFARLNLLLPEEFKRRLLFAIFPKAKQSQGFRSYYDKCTPNDFRKIAAKLGLMEIDFKPYYTSSYFSFFFPLYFVWRVWIVLFRSVRGDQAAETFCMAFKKTAKVELGPCE